MQNSNLYYKEEIVGIKLWNSKIHHMLQDHYIPWMIWYNSILIQFSEQLSDNLYLTQFQLCNHFPFYHNLCVKIELVLQNITLQKENSIFYSIIPLKMVFFENATLEYIFTVQLFSPPVSCTTSHIPYIKEIRKSININQFKWACQVNMQN